MQYSTDSLLGYWKFDETSGSTAYDSSGHANNLNLNSGADFSSSHASTVFPNSRSLTLGSSNSYVSSSSNPAGLQPTSGLTFSMWLFFTAAPSSASTSYIIGGNYYGDSNPYGYYFKLNKASNTIDFVMNNGGTAHYASAPVSSIAASTWINLVGTWNGSQIKIYLNGTNQSSDSFTGTPYTNTSNFKLGPFAYMYPPTKIDDVRIYNRALGSIEVYDLYHGKHLTSTWTGSSSTEYENSINWNPQAIPDQYSLVVVPNVSNQPELSSNQELAGLTINSSASLNIKSYDLALKDSGAFSNDGTLKLNNASTQTLTSFTNDTNSGTVQIQGATAYTGLKTGSSYYNLTFINSAAMTTSAALNVAGNLLIENGALQLGATATVAGNFSLTSGSFTASGNSLTVAGNLNIAGGSFNAGTGNISVAKDWNNTGGTFNAGSGTVIFNGGDQNIYGNNTFNNLTKSPSVASSLLFDRFGFEAGKTQTISNNLNIQGTTAHLINLRSITPGTKWNIDPQGTSSTQRVLNNLDVKDSNNTSGTDINVSGLNIFSSGNNSHWAFETTPPSITLSTIATPASNSLLPIKGTASKSTVSVDLVESQLDSETTNWTACSLTSGNVYNMGFSCVPTSALLDGSHTIRIRAKDVDGNVTDASSYASATFSIDTVTPIISLVSSTHKNTSARIIWVTNENTSSKVQYGKSTSYGSSTSEEDKTTRVTSHEMNLSDLAECTIYHYRVKSKDAAGNEAIGEDSTFKTNDSLGEPGLSDASANGTDSITLKFDSAQGTVDHYEVEYGKSSGSFDNKDNNVGNKDTTKYTAKSLSPGTTYYFRIRAVNSCGKGNWSKVLSAKTEEEVQTTSSDEPASNQTEDTLTNSPTTATITPKESATQPAGSIMNFNGPTDSLWQQKYFGNPNCIIENRCGPNADPDGDGVINADEYRLGTNPNKKDSDSDGLADNTEIELGKNPAKSQNESGGDQIAYESAKENGEVKEEYKVKDVEMIKGDDGEKKLKISGQGPPNSYITVYVYSEIPTVLTVKTDSDGNWSYLLDKQLDDGDHQVYVAVTDNAGKVAAKSEPLAFVKTAEAVTVVPPAEASSSGVSPIKKRTTLDLVSYFALGFFALLLSTIGIGLVIRKSRKKEDVSLDNPIN